MNDRTESILTKNSFSANLKILTGNANHSIKSNHSEMANNESSKKSLLEQAAIERDFNADVEINTYSKRMQKARKELISKLELNI